MPVLAPCHLNKDLQRQGQVARNLLMTNLNPQEEDVLLSWLQLDCCVTSLAKAG